jgi:hypothetical protein
MKKSLFACLALLSGISSFAQLNGDGYYRLQNYMSTRYAYVVNNKGKINVATTSADLSSIALWSDESKALADPSTIIYIKQIEGNKYNLIAQGTSMYDIISHYLQIKDNGNGTYKAYAEQSGMVIYIGDAEQSEYGKGTLATNTKDRWRDWYIKPVDNGDASYLGIKPDVQANGKYYKSYYASFPFTILSSDVKAYYITKVSDTEAAYKQIDSDKVPAATPVFFECESSDQAENRLMPITDNIASISGNILTGVYFDFASGSSEKRNQVTYDSKTMRILGTMSDGSLGFITATDITTIPANTVYITVAETAAAEIKLVTEEDFGKNDTPVEPDPDPEPNPDPVDPVIPDPEPEPDPEPDPEPVEPVNPDEPSNGVVSITTDASSTFDIYTTTGILVKRNATTTEGLSAGIYIAKGQKIVVLP